MRVSFPRKSAGETEKIHVAHQQNYFFRGRRRVLGGGASETIKIENPQEAE